MYMNQVESFFIKCFEGKTKEEIEIIKKNIECELEKVYIEVKED